MAEAERFRQDIAPFEQWRKVVQDEHIDIQNTIKILRRKLDELDRQIGPSKRISGPETKAVERKIEQRRKTHEEVRECEWKFYNCDRTLASLNASLTTAVNSYSRSMMVPFMIRVKTTFPRDVRDMIYTQLLDDAALPLITGQVHQQIDRNCCSNPSKQCLVDYAGIEILDPSFTLTGMGSEILNAAATLISGAHKVPEYIPKNTRLFLDMRALHLDVPVSYFFNDLRIQLHLAGLLAEWRQKQLMADGKESSTGVSVAFQQHLRGLIEDVPEKRERKLRVEVWTENLSSSESDVCKRAVEGALKVARKKEFKSVDILWHGKR